MSHLCPDLYFQISDIFFLIHYVSFQLVKSYFPDFAVSSEELHCASKGPLF